jgi:hypothetical protein
LGQLRTERITNSANIGLAKAGQSADLNFCAFYLFLCFVGQQCYQVPPCTNAFTLPDIVKKQQQ